MLPLRHDAAFREGADIFAAAAALRQIFYAAAFSP